MSHTLSTNVGLCYLNSTLITHDSLESDLLVLTTITLPVLLWPKYSLTEQTVLLRLKCSIVDSLRALYLTM